MDRMAGTLHRGFGAPGILGSIGSGTGSLKSELDIGMRLEAWLN
jgi:hypothetical protein